MSRGKLKKDAIGESEISDYLKSKDDFALEMAVVDAFHTNGLMVEHGGTYTDPIRRIDRQFDVRSVGVMEWRTLRLAVECKALEQSFPLVISRLPRFDHECYLDFLLSTRGHGGPVYKIERCACDVYKQRAFVGKSATQVGRATNGELTGSDSECYDKWSQAIASAAAFADQAISDFKLPEPERLTSATAILPILVVSNDTLWAVDYTQKGEILKKPHLVKECLLYIDKAVTIHQGVMKISHLHVFTLEGFEKFLAKLANNQLYLNVLFPNHLLQKIDTLEGATGFRLNR